VTDLEHARAIEELREREAAFRAFAGAVPGSTWTATPDGALTFIGSDWQELDPDQHARAMGWGWLDEVHADDRDRVRAAWMHALRTGDPYDIEFRVRRTTGDYGWLWVRAMPVVDAQGAILRWVGLNLDVNDRYEADHSRDMFAALVERSWNFIAIGEPDGSVRYVNAAGRELLGIASVCHDQRPKQRIEDGLQLLSRTGAAIVDSLDYQRTLDNIARAFVDGFAAFCVIDVIPAGGRWQRTVAHRDPISTATLVSGSTPRGGHPVARALESRESTILSIDRDWIEGLSLAPDRAEAIRKLDLRSLICVPVVTPADDVVGALSCFLDAQSDRDDYESIDLGFVEEVARRAGAAIANVREYERERRVAIELQAASLPARLPAIDGIRLDAAYRPGSTEANIGGDWYDAFLVDDGRLVITCGDVLGHGLHAAVSMTKLRLAMQSAAMVDADPHLMLRVADATLRVSDPDAYATAIAAVYDPATRRLRVASAGHPHPLLRRADGTIDEIVAAGLMIGLRFEEPPNVTTVDVPPGATVAFYTDGLIEFNRDQDAGLERLIVALGEGVPLAGERPAESIVAAVLAGERARDDIAVLVARFE